MGIRKMSLANIQGKLSRAEMKSIMAGSGSCPTACGKKVGNTTYVGTCKSTTTNSGTFCVCSVYGGSGC